jgi:50S ribosome-binding GTPase
MSILGQPANQLQLQKYLLLISSASPGQSPKSTIATPKSQADSNKDKNALNWEGAIVAVVGLYDKGKTFVLNNLSSSNLPSGKKVNTKGLSFKYVNVDGGTKLILLDTAGSYSPVKVQNNMSIIEREATEHFILELVFDVSDYFLFVVNDFTSLDQRYLDKLTRSLQTSANKSFREVIVVHNFKEVESQDILDHIWETQVKQIYADGSTQTTLVAATNPMTGKLEEKKVTWFKSPFTRHVCIVNHDSLLGMNHNPWSFSLLRYWLKAVLVPLNREFSVVDNVINFSDSKLSVYFKEKIDLVLADTDDPLNKKIVNKVKLADSLR